MQSGTLRCINMFWYGISHNHQLQNACMYCRVYPIPPCYPFEQITICIQRTNCANHTFVAPAERAISSKSSCCSIVARDCRCFNKPFSQHKRWFQVITCFLICWVLSNLNFQRNWKIFCIMQCTWHSTLDVS
jgi:hypothetical protein